MVVMPGGLVKRGECWFDDEPEPGVDVVHFTQCPKPRADSFTEFYTLVIDLEKEPEDILGAMNSTTRNEIRRAEGKDLLRQEWKHNPSTEYVEEFCDFFDEFSRLKLLPLMDRSKAHAYSSAGVLRFSRMLARDGTLLTWSAFYGSEERLRWLWGPSLFRASDDPSFRQVVGRATRYNHYCCMLQAREMGIEVYDLGGWYPGDTDQARLSINKFKEGLGGRMLIEYNGTVPMTLLGRTYLLAQRARQLAGR